MAVTIRGSNIQASSNSSYTVPWPTGTVTNDLAVIMVGHAYVASAPSGWLQHSNLSGALWNGAVFSKILTAADITAGSVTVNVSGSYSGVVACVTTQGAAAVTPAPPGTSDSVNSSSGAATVSLTATPTIAAGDLVLYFGSNRAVSTDTVNRGTLDAQITDNANGSGCLYYETGITSSTAVYAYSVPGDGYYQALIVLAPAVAPLTLKCAGTATLDSAYFVVWFSRTNIPLSVGADLPPEMSAVLSGGVTTLDSNAATWTVSYVPPVSALGVWDPSVTYVIGDTVHSKTYTLDCNPPEQLVYRSLRASNKGHDPDLLDGWWTCISKCAQVDTKNSGFSMCPFGYVLSPPPTHSTITSSQWQASLEHSLFWNAPAPPGDIAQLYDIYIQLNYIANGVIVPLHCLPTSYSVTTGNEGQILNPGINAQFQCWRTSSLSTNPILILSSFQDRLIDGAEAAGTVGKPYLSTLVPLGGTPPYTFAIIAGGFPPGVTLDPQTGVISGTPQQSGIFNFTAQVTDSNGLTATVTCAIPVSCPTGAAAGAGNRFY